VLAHQRGIIGVHEQQGLSVMRVQGAEGFPDDRQEQFRLHAQTLPQDLIGNFDRQSQQLIGDSLIDDRQRLVQLVQQRGDAGPSPQPVPRRCLPVAGGMAGSVLASPAISRRPLRRWADSHRLRQAVASSSPARQAARSLLRWPGRLPRPCSSSKVSHLPALVGGQLVLGNPACS
jgi:hypothetical protein